MYVMCNYVICTYVSLTIKKKYSFFVLLALFIYFIYHLLYL